MTSTITLSGGTLGNTVLTLNLDNDLRAIDFGSEQECTPVVSDWLNSVPDIQTDIWSKKKETVTYTIRQTDVELYALFQCLEDHGMVLLKDSAHPYTHDVFITKVEAAYDAHTSWVHPWLIMLELKICTFVDVPTWCYRKSHLIIGAVSADTNYQVRIKLNRTTGTDSGENVYFGTKCNVDFSDIRFTDDDEITELDYWIETPIVGNTAYAWVEVADSLASDRTIYIYYGNSTATTTSNGDDTFVFFDDFATLDNWTVHSGTWVAENGCAKATVGGWLKRTYAHTNLAFVFRAKSMKVDANYYGAIAGLRLDTNIENGAFFAWRYHGYMLGQQMEASMWHYTGGWTNLFAYSKVLESNTWYLFDCGFTSIPNESDWEAFTEFNRDGNLKDSHKPVGTTAVQNTGSVIGICASSADISNPVYFDWFAARKYCHPEPTHSTWGDEEAGIWYFN